ncbi:MAG: 1-deoxy-D-xylulose-5-phosphate reductoisomerase [Clostridia bacterium]|nr:1-deoxy-D-xylulose-5-phosphate reductoisomerase [Clostridia bacterium]
MRSIAILGATGSIGTQTLDIVRRYPGRFYACALAAKADAEGMFRLAREFKPRCCALVNESEIPEDLKHIEWFFGEDAAPRMLRACGADDALCAVVGIAGLDAVLTALDCCKRVLLANKEALVTGGSLVMEKARRLSRELLPVDSEHSAIFQCLKAAQGNPVEKLILTCSGGALRQWDEARIQNATVSQVLQHPTWRMGSKITVDCASLMNKGLEVIEASYLFDMPEDKIDVVIHPQSVIHSMVAFEDGAVLAQMGKPDMRGPIAYAMGHPERLPYGQTPLDFAALGALTFEAPDTKRFPCLSYAREAFRAGGSAPVILNGANEAAVEAFLKGEIRFGRIAQIVRRALNECKPQAIRCPQDVHEADILARAQAQIMIRALPPEV